jgi:hypothetical protein
MYQEIKEVDRIEIATEIFARMEMEYKYATNKEVDKVEAIKFLAEQLKSISDNACLGWYEALNRISELGREHPPTIPEIIVELRKIEIAMQPKAKALEYTKSNYASLWNICDTTRQKLEFLSTVFSKKETPPSTKYHIKKWMIADGWDSGRIKMTLGI